MPKEKEKPKAVAGEPIGPPVVATVESPMREIPAPAQGPNPTGHTDQALFAHGPLLTGPEKTQGDQGKER